MKPSEKEILIHRLIDGELDAAEEERVRALLEEDAELRADAEALQGLSRAIKGEVPAEVVPPSADFFNSHILRQIGGGAAAAGHGREAVRRPSLSWFALPWGIAAAALALAAVLVFQDRSGGAQAGQSVVSAPYTPAEGVTAEAFYSEAAGATVIRLEGLEALPDEREIHGHAAVSYRRDGAVGAAHLRDGDGRLLFVMLGDAEDGAPTFFQP